MRIRKIRDYLFDNRKDVQERLFVLLTVIALGGMITAFVASLILGENAEGILAMLFAFLVLTTAIFLGLKYDRIRLTANILTAMIIYIFFPIVFFTSGGVYGGSPIWFVFAMLFTSMLIRGRVRIVLLVSQFIVAAVCYYIGYRYPQIVIPHTEKEFYLDSLASFAVVSFIMTLMITFQVYLLRRDNETVEKQKEEIRALDSVADASFYLSRTWADGITRGRNSLDSGMILGVDTLYLSTTGYSVFEGRRRLYEVSVR